MMEGWHIDKRVSISHILTTMVVVVGIFWWAGETETRLALLEQAVKTNQEQMIMSDQRNATMFKEIRESLRRIEDKIDKKADK